MNQRHAFITTDLGKVTLTATDQYLTGLYFPGHKPQPDASTFGQLVEAATDDLFSQVETELADYFIGNRQEFTVPLATAGDEFSEQVWALIKQIPYGQTTSYGALAKQLGNRHLAQRVGQAVGRNPISVVIPCHRVVGADGSLTGYAGGIERKRRLLEIEEPADKTQARLF